MSRRGLTLVEMAVSLVVIGVLLVACGSVLRLAAATTDMADRNAAQLAAADAAARVEDDLHVAGTFSRRTATAMTFTVPDRLGTGSPQTVAYAWSGTAGDPLTRAFNGGVATTLLPDVRAFAVAYDTRAVTVASKSEQTAFDHLANSGSNATYNLTDKNWASQAFQPGVTAPLGTYSITRVRLALKATNVDSVLTVSVRPADLALKPTATVLAQTRLYVSALSTSFEWIDVPFTGLSGLNPLTPLCVVVSYNAGSNNAAVIQYDQSLLTILSNGKWATSTDAGVSWSTSTFACARMAVYATVP